MAANGKSTEKTKSVTEGSMTIDGNSESQLTPKVKPSKPRALRSKSTNKKSTTESLKPAKKILKEEKSPKKEKRKKIKMVRDSFTMPENEYSQIAALKKKCLKSGVQVKKSELLRVGLAYLGKLSDTALTQAVEQLEKIKTGRPAKA